MHTEGEGVAATVAPYRQKPDRKTSGGPKVHTSARDGWMGQQDLVEKAENVILSLRSAYTAGDQGKKEARAVESTFYAAVMAKNSGRSTYR